MTKSKNQELTERAVNEGWLMPTPENCFWLLTPKMTKLIKKLHDLLINNIAHELEFEEWIFPRIIPESSIKNTGWLKYHPQQAFTVGTLPNSDYPQNRYMLDPIQCVSLYNALKDQNIDFKLPLKVVEYLGGWSYRNESAKDLDGFFKSKSFLRIEFITIGDEQSVIDLRNFILSKSLKLFKDEFGLAFDKAKGDSCFIESPQKDEKQYNLLGSQVNDKTETIDIVYKRQETNEILELASGSIVGNHITNNFSIKSEKLENLCSGCFGFGLNRIALVILEVMDFKI